MREIAKRTIDGEDYEFCQLDADTSTRLLIRVGRILGVPLAAGISSAKEGIKGMLDGDVNIERGVNELFNRADEDTVMKIIHTMLGQTIHTGSGELSKCFKEHFKGRIGHMFKVVAEAAKVEYSDFFDALPDLQGMIKRAKDLKKGQAT